MIEFETKRLLLRKFRREDKVDLFDILSDEQTTLDDGGFHAFSKMDEEYEKLMEKFETQDRYSIVEKETNYVVGTINLREDDRAVKTYELGYAISPKRRRKGYAYESVSSLIKVMFEQTDVQMFAVGHFPQNEASKALIEKLGFVYEGIDHKALFHEVYGPTDLICYYMDKPCDPTSNVADD